MSFTTDVTEELLRLPLKKTCCRKALLLGLFFGCREQSEDGTMTLYLYSKGTAELAKELLQRIYHAEATVAEVVRAGRRTVVLSVRAAGIAFFLADVDRGTESMLHQAAGFRCASCGQEFLRGAFLGCATVNDPHKGYHLEFTLPTEKRADLLSDYLGATFGRVGRIRRKEKIGLYYKNNAAISDLLYYVGCSKTSFDVANVCIERDIRNNENRATNCVARNISRSVDASRKQINAIELLIATRKIDALPDELRYTAELRMEYDSASLFELAMLHEPPISKSGLNRRLSKLMEAAEEIESVKDAPYFSFAKEK
ncbi:MAG: DNA-binding protein WhiA [Clostridia bacterium]|nr:DNA-binding protein WhiA [Clostridia bacterium]